MLDDAKTLLIPACFALRRSILRSPHGAQVFYLTLHGIEPLNLVKQFRDSSTLLDDK
jgi:hypothetical protein